MISLIFAKLTAPLFAAATCSHSFFFLPDWWEYLPKGSQPTLANGCEIGFAFPADIWLIGLAILDMLLRLVGFAAVVSIMIAGFQLQFTGGNPEKAASARRRLLNSIYGMVIAFLAAAVVTFFGKQLSS